MTAFDVTRQPMVDPSNRLRMLIPNGTAAVASPRYGGQPWGNTAQIPSLAMTSDC